MTALPAPSMAQRHARSLEGYLTPKMGGPRARTVSQSLLGGQESVLPFGIGLQEFVPFSPYVGEEAGAMIREGQETDSGLTTGLGLGLGALQALPVAKPLARGAKAAGKALGPKAAEMAEGYLLKSGLAPQLTAYHGTPHKFAPEEGAPLGKFKTEKIGTGEGAQAYGHGIYFAESPGVAEDYRNVLGSPRNMVAKGRGVYIEPSPMGDGKYMLATRSETGKMVGTAGDATQFIYPDKTFNSLADAMRFAKKKGLIAKEARPQLVAINEDGKYVPIKKAADVEDPQYSQFIAADKGSLYTVDIPDEMIPRMLDWDKPLSQQSKEVQEALQNSGLLVDVSKVGEVAAEKIRRLAEQPRVADWAKRDLLQTAAQLEKSPSPKHVAGVLKGMQLEYGINADSGPFSDVANDFLSFVKGMQAVPNMDTGGGAVSYLEALYGPSGASQRLKEAGIPGVRYLDQGSRDTGKGTSNFVVFPGEEEKVKILERKAEGGLVTDTDAIAAKLKSTGMDDQKAFMQALRMADARQEAHMAGGGLLKALKGAKAAAEAPKPVAGPQAKALETARKNAVKAGLSPDPNTRMLQLGFGPDWYHGSSGDIKAFRPDYLGESTGAQSAKKAYFFARDPQNPPPEMLEKAPASSESVQLLKRLGIPEEEIAKLNEVSMKGHGAETASGYSAIGGSREYKEAMRKANAAERSGNWDEYHKWMQIAEDTEIGRSQDLQRRVAEYGEKRDVMLDRINNALLSKPLPQEEATALDAKMKQLMPYGWYNIYSLPQFESLKGELVKLAGPNAAPALKSIDDFMSVKANRMLEETYEEGSNVMPVALRYKNPMVHDYGGSSYRDESYSDLIDQAQALGHDALILKNTFDPGRGPAKLVDVAAVFKPEQVRSRFAAFDPARINESDLLGAADPALLAGVAVGSGLGLDAIRRIKKEEQKPEEQKKARGGLAKRV
jgi:hypothetical protein